MLRALAVQLPADWVVVTNVCWSERTAYDGPGPAYVRDGQADLVVIAPGLGLIVIEVKGSRFVKVGEDGCWYRSSNGLSWEKVSKSPPEQAMHNAHQITALLERQLGWQRFPSRFGYLVVYPQGAITGGGLRTFDSSTAVFKTQMADLRTRITTALRARGAEPLGAAMSRDLALQIARVLTNQSLIIGPVDTTSDARADADAIEILTRQQSAALQGIFRHPRVAVTGPAGSGKTVLAIWRLTALLDEGRKAICLCYNRLLAEHLRRQHPAIATSILHVDSCFTGIIPASRRRTAADPQRYFDEDLPGLVVDEVSLWSEDRRLDGLVIDEGQDFGELRLLAAQSMLRDEGSYLYCSDDRQDLYDRSRRKAVGAEVVFSLVHNCRNTVRINATSNRALGEPVPPMPGLPEGVETIVQRHVDRSAVAKAAWRLADSWSHDAVRLVILSPFKLENSAMATQTNAYNRHIVTELAQWGDRGTVLFSTVKSFKGIEADAVIVVDVDIGEGGRGDLYVACTRARARLALLTTSEPAVAALSG